MKIYYRLLSLTSHVPSRLFQFLIYSFLGSIFSASFLGLLQPMLEILFFQKTDKLVTALPAFSLSKEYFTNTFNYYFHRTVEMYGPATTLLYICIGIIGFVFLANVSRYMERMVASRVKVDIVKNLRTAIFNNVSRLHIGYFTDQRKGDLISRFTNDVSEVENTIVNGFKAIKEPITLIVYLTMLFLISVKLSVVTLVVLPITGGIISTIVKQLKKKASASQETMGRIVNILDEAFGGMRVINAFNARGFLQKKIEDETGYHRNVNLSMARRNELASPLSEFFGITVVAGILFYGGSSIINGEGEFTPASFFLFLTVYASMLQPAKMFANGITSLQKGVVAAERIFSIIDVQSAIQNKPNAIVLKQFEKNIIFKNVSFSYDKEPVLRDINITIEKGKTIALVGASGGGKSTLADLIPRFYDPTEGQVLLDGIPLPDYELDSLRQVMGIVTQESILFNDTIFNNIAFGMGNVREEDVIRAAQVANAHDFIMQSENGYRTFIGERGSKLSGGQRQRLSIARAVLKNPPILILDEATSALDSESERLVQDALTKLMRNRTSVVIAHRLSTIQHADEIIVIQQGQIVERGGHEALLRYDGVYKKLIEIQKL